MDIDSDCLLNSHITSIYCGGESVNLRDLLEKPAPDTNLFGSLLEYLLYKGAIFNLCPVNLYEKTICLHHFKYLSKDVEFKGRCKTCKPVCKREKESTNAGRRVSKQLAVAIFEYGFPEQHWAFYDEPICDGCRKHLTVNYVTDEIRSKCEHIFDWLYNKEVVYTPVSSAIDDDNESFEYHIDDQFYAPEADVLGKLKQFLDETSFDGRCESTSSYTWLKEKSKSNLRNQVKGIFLHILKCLTPNDIEKVWNDILKHELKVFKDEEVNNTALAAINNAVENAEHYSTKRQLLALVAADYPSKVLRAHFPNITNFQIKAARKHAYLYGEKALVLKSDLHIPSENRVSKEKSRGAPVELSRSGLERYDEQKVSHFLEFLLSPSITSDLPFGTRSMKMETGEKLEIANTCRNMIPTRIIRQYQNYCFETTNGEFQPLGFTSLMAILNSCPASTRKSMQGIDDYSANGSTAFDSLLKLCDELSSYQISVDLIAELRKSLQQSRNYIKIDYKMHVSTTSTIPDHCSTFALSDSEEQMWSNSCDHKHDDKCKHCDLLDATLTTIRSLIRENLNIPEENKIRLMKSFTRDADLIQEWKKHQLRAVHQEAARDHALECLDEKSVFLVIDWAMKWMEKKYRQSQADFYAMRGLPWHLTHVVRVQPPNSSVNCSRKVFQNRTFCHCFDNCIQNGSTVVSILQDIFMRLKQQNPEIETAYVRSDNAGCYHGADTLLAVQELYETTGVLIRRIDFSEAQAGKGPCDRKAAVIKGEVRRYVDEKHDCTTSAEFVAAAKSTHYLSIFSCELPTSKTSRFKNKWDGIKSYSNIEFTLKNSLTSDIQKAKPTVSSSKSSTIPEPVPPSSIFSTTLTTTSLSSSTSSITFTPTSYSSSTSLITFAPSPPSLLSTPPTTFASKTSMRTSRRSRKSISSISETESPGPTASTPVALLAETIANKSPVDLEIRVWRAFQIGIGKCFKFSDFKPPDKITSLKIDPKAQYLNDEWKSEAPVEEEINDDDESSEEVDSDADDRMDTSQHYDGLVNQFGFDMWECTHERCVLQFRRRSDRDNHMDTGKHKFESNKIGLVEKAKIMYKNRLENEAVQPCVTLGNFPVVQNFYSSINRSVLHQGWALPSKKVSKRFNMNQKQFMIDAYDQGERTGFKISPATLAIDMPYIKENGKFRFTPEEWLTSKQIKSFFSNITRNRRKKANSTLYQNQNNSQSLQPKRDQPSVNGFASISTIGTRTYSDIDDSMEQIIADSNNDDDTNDEDTSDDDFDAHISTIDMENMLKSAEATLLPRATTS